MAADAGRVFRAQGPSGLSHAFAGYGQPVPTEPDPASASSFSGHDPDAPSGLNFAAVVPPVHQGEPGYQPAGDTFPAPAYSDPDSPQAATAPASGGYGPAGGGMPGYLQPYGPGGGPIGKGPGVGPVVGFTFFFGAFGAISAARRAERARAVGDSTGKYWIAFGATLAGCWVVGAISASCRSW